MKRVILVMAMAFALSACGGGGGGGGGGAAPSVNSDDSPPPEETRRLTPAEQAEVRTAANRLRSDLDSLENNAEADSLRQEIDALLADIDNFRLTITELQNEIANLRSEIDTLKEKPPSPPDETTTPPPDETTTPPPDETMTPPPDETMTPPDETMTPPDETMTPPDETTTPPPDETPTPPPDETITPSVYDTAEFRGNYALARMGALHAYNNGAHGQGVTVAIRDSAIRNTHEDLAANIVTLAESARNNFSQDANKSLHGTAVAGIIAGARNGNDVHGVAPSVKIITDVPRALSSHYENVRILNTSLGSADIGVSQTAGVAAITTDGTLIFRANDRANLYADLDLIEVRGLANDYYNTVHNTINAPQFAAYYPFIRPDIEDNYLMVGALNTLTVAALFTNGCGVAMMWCVFAFGQNHLTTDSDSDTAYRRFFGTSASTPHVSGALALLKSAAPELPMAMIRQILLTTATDLGEEGIDEVYGWGGVNVSAGIEHIENLETAEGTALRDLRQGLPSEFSHLRGRLSEVSVALKITDDSYYNIPLSDIVGGGDSQKTSLGNAAKEMQADDSLSPENSGFGFNYANGDYDLHYAGGGNGGNENAFRFSGGLRHDDSQSSYIGEGGGIFSAENASDTGGYVKWTTKDYGGISAFGEYGRTQIKADYDSASFISQIQNARAEEWTAGFQYRDLFLHNDSLQFSARQESRISGGEMVLHYPVADGDSHKAFIGESPQTIRTETAKIPIKQKPQTIYTAGYSQKTENSKWSAAAEWNSATNAKGVSFAVEFALH